MLAALAVVILLWQPEWRTIIHPDTKPKIAILWDDSKSMTTIDAPLPPVLSAKSEIVSRADWVEKALASELWKPLEAAGANEVEALSFATPDADKPALSGTDLETPLSELLENQNNLRAVVLFSDGDYNLGQPPVVAAQKMRLRGVPLFPIPVGSQTRLPDLDLLSVTAPTYGIIGENVQIPFTIRSSLDRAGAHHRPPARRVRPRANQGHRPAARLPRPTTPSSGASTRKAPPPSNSRSRWPMANSSQPTTRASSPSPAGRKRSACSSSRRLPRWEYRFLRNALSRDPGVELSCLLFHPQLGPGGGKDYIEEFPEKPEDLAKYDVIFLGDVGVATDQLTKEQCALIRGLVENQASGVIFMPGPQGNQISLLDTDSVRPHPRHPR